MVLKRWCNDRFDLPRLQLSCASSHRETTLIIARPANCTQTAIATFLSPCSWEICSISSPLYAGGLISSALLCTSNVKNLVKFKRKEITCSEFCLFERSLNLFEVFQLSSNFFHSDEEAHAFTVSSSKLSIAPSILFTSSSNIKKLSCFEAQALIIHKRRFETHFSDKVTL